VVAAGCSFAVLPGTADTLSTQSWLELRLVCTVEPLLVAGMPVPACSFGLDRKSWVAGLESSTVRSPFVVAELQWHSVVLTSAAVHIGRLQLVVAEPELRTAAAAAAEAVETHPSTGTAQYAVVAQEPV
jgi:hypothetical protein